VIARTARLALGGLVAASLAASVARAQSPHTVSVRIDNDAFDFWMQPYNRPDEEYTSGVHLTYDGATTPWWWWSFLGGAACTPGAQHCRSARAELGQDIYTPSVSAGDPLATTGSRASAGWLYFSHAAELLRRSRSDAFTITLGVTGPPSLARVTQRIAHEMAPEFNRPTDWSRQIRFEPGAIVGYEHRERLLAVAAGPFGFDVVPSISLEAGNVRTAASANLETRLGVNLPHPWMPSTAPVSATIIAGVTERGVLRDLFLDGNTVRPDYRVGHEPFVGAGELGLELRMWHLSTAYRVVTQTRSYVGGPRWHPWASLVAGLTFDR
jgi:lipid A 3-O-deacylase